MVIEKPIITLIGAGHMGSALIGGLIAHDHPAEKLVASDPSQEALDALQKKFHLSVTTDNKIAIQNADVIILAVKPPLVSVIAKELASLIQTHKPLIISIAAGIEVKTLEEPLGNDIAIVRVMPNTPALIGCGASALYANAAATDKHRALAQAILQCVGITVWVKEEKHINAVTALSGSGPAYFFLIMEAMQEAGVELGLTTEISHLLTLQTAYGAARLAQTSQASLQELRHQVTSKGGTTESALQVFEKGALCPLIKKALHAAYERATELGKGEISS